MSPYFFSRSAFGTIYFGKICLYKNMYYKKTMLSNFITELHQFNTGNGFNYSNAHFLISDHHLYNFFVTVYLYRWKCLCQLNFVFRARCSYFYHEDLCFDFYLSDGRWAQFWEVFYCINIEDSFWR